MDALLRTVRDAAEQQVIDPDVLDQKSDRSLNRLPLLAGGLLRFVRDPEAVPFEPALLAIRLADGGNRIIRHVGILAHRDDETVHLDVLDLPEPGRLAVLVGDKGQRRICERELVEVALDGRMHPQRINDAALIEYLQDFVVNDLFGKRSDRLHHVRRTFSAVVVGELIKQPGRHIAVAVVLRNLLHAAD